LELDPSVVSSSPVESVSDHTLSSVIIEDITDLDTSAASPVPVLPSVLGPSYTTSKPPETVPQTKDSSPDTLGSSTMSRSPSVSSSIASAGLTSNFFDSVASVGLTSNLSRSVDYIEVPVGPDTGLGPYWNAPTTGGKRVRKAKRRS
jgi:hypothetical protein